MLAGVSLRACGRVIPPKSFRAFYGTQMLKAGYSPGQVASLLGHESDKHVLKHYIRMSIEDKAAFAKDAPL